MAGMCAPFVAAIYDRRKARQELLLMASGVVERRYNPLPAMEPLLRAIFLGREFRRTSERLSGELLALDFRRKQGRESLAKGFRQSGQLNAALVEETATRSSLRAAGNLLALEEEIVPNGIGKTGVGNFWRSRNGQFRVPSLG